MQTLPEQSSNFEFPSNSEGLGPITGGDKDWGACSNSNQLGLDLTPLSLVVVCEDSPHRPALPPGPSPNPESQPHRPQGHRSALWPRQPQATPSQPYSRAKLKLDALSKVAPCAGGTGKGTGRKGWQC
eukprot:scaffold13896_cov120-Isochrysis_galbana.AAC.6